MPRGRIVQLEGKGEKVRPTHIWVVCDKVLVGDARVLCLQQHSNLTNLLPLQHAYTQMPCFWAAHTQQLT